jgi:hypothetical protein
VETTQEIVSRVKFAALVELEFKVSADAHFAVCAVKAGWPPPLSLREKRFRFGFV